MAGTTLRKESAACVDAEISILMQREAENDRAQDAASWGWFGVVANLLRGFGEMRREAVWRPAVRRELGEVPERLYGQKLNGAMWRMYRFRGRLRADIAQ